MIVFKDFKTEEFKTWIEKSRDCPQEFAMKVGGPYLARSRCGKAAGQRHVQEVIRRCNSEEDLTMALSALEKLRRHRANALNHEPFNNHTCMLLMEVRMTEEVESGLMESPDCAAIVLSVVVIIICGCTRFSDCKCRHNMKSIIRLT
jgi:hypothetical protein